MRRDDRASDDPRAIGAQKTLSLSSSFLTSSTSDAWLACATRAVTGTSACAWQSRIRFSPRGKEEIADFRYRAGRALSGRPGALKCPIHTRARTPRSSSSPRSYALPPSLGPSSSFVFSLRRNPGGRKECAGHVHSSHGEEYNVDYLAARSDASERTRASERAGGRARTSALP